MIQYAFEVHCDHCAAWEPADHWIRSQAHLMRIYRGRGWSFNHAKNMARCPECKATKPRYTPKAVPCGHNSVGNRQTDRF
jgi:hypothetical protein